MRTPTALLALALLTTACANDQDPQLKPCVYASQALAFPHPGWGAGETFGPPAHDRATELLEEVRPSWHADLTRVDGWPKLPTLLVPLSGPAATVAPDKLALYGRAADETTYRPTGVVLRPQLTEVGDVLIVRTQGPLPPWTEEAVLVVTPGALSGAQALAVCGPDGQPHPDYAAAEASLHLDGKVELALPFQLSRVHRDLSATYSRLAAQPALTVGSIEARGPDSFGAAAPTPEVAQHIKPTVAHAILDLPDYRGADGNMTLAADGGLEAQSTTHPGILVVLPATGSAPHPWVLFQHGGGQDKSEVFRVAGPLAEAGFAFVAVDLPYHGDRASPSGGSDLDILDFEQLLDTRDNFRQAAADHQAVITGIPELNAALAGVLGQPDLLDPDRAFYMGLSMGAISGSLTFATAWRLRAAALFVGGCDYPRLVTFGVFSLFISDIMDLPATDRLVVLALAELLLDGSDPAAYAQRTEDRRAPPRPALFFQAVEEAIIDPPVSDDWALAFGADLASPHDHAVAGMEALTLPAADNFSWPEGSGAATRLLFQNPMAEVPLAERHGGLIRMDYSQENVAACFSGLLSGGSCQVQDTGYQDH